MFFPISYMHMYIEYKYSTRTYHNVYKLIIKPGRPIFPHTNSITSANVVVVHGLFVLGGKYDLLNYVRDESVGRYVLW